MGTMQEPSTSLNVKEYSHKTTQIKISSKLQNEKSKTKIKNNQYLSIIKYHSH